MSMLKIIMQWIKSLFAPTPAISDTSPYSGCTFSSKRDYDDDDDNDDDDDDSDADDDESKYWEMRLFVCFELTILGWPPSYPSRYFGETPQYTSNMLRRESPMLPPNLVLYHKQARAAHESGSNKSLLDRMTNDELNQMRENTIRIMLRRGCGLDAARLKAIFGITKEAASRYIRNNSTQSTSVQ